MSRKTSRSAVVEEDVVVTGTGKAALQEKKALQKVVDEAGLDTTNIARSGFFGESRQYVRALVESLGASYSGELVEGVSTHLVCAQGANCNGVLKVKKAQEWGIPVVSVDWLKDSEDVGCLLDASLYLLLESSKPIAAGPGNCSRQSRQHNALHSCLRGPPEVLRSAVAATSEVGSSCMPGTAISANAPLPEHVTQRPRPRARVLPVKPESPASSELSVMLSPESEDLASTSLVSNVDAVLSSLALRDEDPESQGTSERTEQTSGEGSSWVGEQEAESPGAQVRVRKKLSKVPRKSLACGFHGADNIKFYRELSVVTNDGTMLSFDTKDGTHCALLSYESKDGEEELAYCDLLHAYTMPDGEVWIEHGYLYDASDVEEHPTGANFLKQAKIANNELVNTRSIYHSPASVIAGEFWLYASKAAMQRAKNRCPTRLAFFVDKYWDRETGAMSKIPKAAKSKSAILT